MMRFHEGEAAKLPRTFVLALLILGTILFATIIPGVFIIDEDNYLVNVMALRRGHVAVANTAGLSPSSELIYFDPSFESRIVNSTPVASTAPPLYGPVAVPFSWFGWRGLVALNILAYLATTAFVFVYAARYAIRLSTPWLAAGAFALGGFVLEYAQGLWPHALSLALCTGGILVASQVLERGRPTMAAASGLLLALAAGIRYQNAIVLGAVGAGIFLWSARRWRNTVAFSLAAALPLGASAAMNYARLGSWNPISKGPRYINVPLLNDPTTSFFDPLVMFWARIVDFSVRPPLVGPSFAWMRYDPESGAHLMLGSVAQKSLLQSAPWAILAFLVLAGAWLPFFGLPDRQRRQLRFLSLITTAVILVFACSGVFRHEGLSFNQRYHLELLPLLAVGFAWALDRFEWRERPILAGVLCGMLPAVLLVFGMAPGSTRIVLLLKFPLILAALLLGLWFLPWRGKARLLVPAVASACLGWGLALHLADDVEASRRLRRANYERTENLRAIVPDRSAVITYWGTKDAAGALMLDRDVVILDTRADAGKDAPMLIDELLAQQRRVFVIHSNFPRDVLSRVLEGRVVVPLPASGVVELRAAPAEAAQP
jgi:hypothetical protein